MSSQFTWALRLPLSEAKTLAVLRTSFGVQVAVARDGLWLGGSNLTPELDILLRQLPVQVRYEVTAQRALRVTGERLLSGALPDLVWLPLSGWVKPVTPPTVLPAAGKCQVPLRLVRSAHEERAALLLTRLTAFQKFAETAPLVRLQRLEFAATPDGRCLVRGTPLPALPGDHWLDHGGFAVRAGFSWEPALAPELVRQWLVTEEGGTILWHEDDTLTRITAEQWVTAERSAIRLSGELNHV